MINLHLFGAQTPTGEALKRQLCLSHHTLSLFSYSRHEPSLLPLDLNDPGAFRFGGDPGVPAICISFGPIWLLASFLEDLSLNHPDRLQSLRGLIACSSSSVITKRFASNRFDRELVARLTSSEDRLHATCRHLDLPCRILRPTLIYGRVGPFVDKNLSRLTSLMRRLPLLPLPAHTGLRQPIHACQLAAVVTELVHQFTTNGWNSKPSQIITLGGDTEISYADMLSAIQLLCPGG